MSFKWADVADDDNDEGMTPESDDTSQKTYTLADLQAAREEERERVVDACATAFDECFATYLSIHGVSFDELRKKLDVIRALGDKEEGKK